MNMPGLVPILTLLMGGTGIGALLKVWLDHKRGKRKQTDEVALALVGRLEERVEKLEADLEAERQRCETELRVLRHRINNQRMLIYSLLHLIDAPVAKRKAGVETVRAELAALEQAEALEKGAALAGQAGIAPTKGMDA